MSKKKENEEEQKQVSAAVNDTETTVDGEAKKPEKPEEKPPEGQMFIKVYSPFKSYFDALGTSISAINDTGEFDILAGHHRFLTLLSPCEIDIRVAEGEGEKIKIDRGIMYVKEDRVTVFLDV